MDSKISNESRLREVVNRFEELEAHMADPAIFQEQERYLKTVREHASLEPVVASWKKVSKLKSDLDEARQMLDEAGQDDELRELAENEAGQLEEALEREEAVLSELLIPRDPRDDKNIIMEIRGGVGGEEAALFAAELYSMYRAYAENRGFSIEEIDLSDTELGGVKEAVFMVRGQGAWSRLKYEAGGHRVQRVPVTESGGRIHTSAVTVAVMPEADEVDFHIDPKDLRVDTYRASGAGGQHVNKTSSAIRITHLPTGIVVTCQDERSQHKNRDKAMAVLRSRLYEMQQEEINSQVAAERKSQVGSGDRSNRIRTYNFPQDRVTDHRIGLSIYNIEDILAGNLDQIIGPLMQAERTRELASSGTDAED